MKIAMTGSSGLVGTAVSAALRAQGHTVTRLVRSREAAAAGNAIYWSPARGEIDAPALGGHEAVIHLAGENIAGLWTPAKKRRIRESRVAGTRLLAETLSALPEGKRPTAMVNASGFSYYGDRPPDEPLAEDAPPGDTFLARVVQAWERAADPAREAGIRVLHLRFGLVLDPDALLLKGLSVTTRIGLGATFGHGRQPLPWVTRDEIARVVAFVLENGILEGPVNVTAPEKVTNRELVDTVARVLRRPRVLRVPAVALRMLGDLGEDLLAGAWVVPAKLEAAGYRWTDPSLEPALRRLLVRA